MSFSLSEGFIYVASPLGAATEDEVKENMERAKSYVEQARTAFQMRALAPHAFLPEYLNDMVDTERELAVSFGLGLLNLSEGIAIFGDHLSEGVKGEILKGKEWGKPVYIMTDCPEVEAFVKKNGIVPAKI